MKKNSSSRNAIFNDNFLPAIALIHDNFHAEQFQILKAIGSSALSALSTRGNIIVCVRLAAAAALTPAALKGGVSLSHFFVLEYARERETRETSRALLYNRRLLHFTRHAAESDVIVLKSCRAIIFNPTGVT